MRRLVAAGVIGLAVGPVLGRTRYVPPPDIGPITAVAADPLNPTGVCVATAAGEVACSELGDEWRVSRFVRPVPGLAPRREETPPVAPPLFGRVAALPQSTGDEVLGFTVRERSFEEPGGTPSGALRRMFGASLYRGADAPVPRPDEPGGLRLRRVNEAAPPALSGLALARGVRGAAAVWSGEHLWSRPNAGARWARVVGLRGRVLGAAFLGPAGDTLVVATSEGFHRGPPGALARDEHLDVLVGAPAGVAPGGAEGVAVFGEHGCVLVMPSGETAVMVPGPTEAAVRGRKWLILQENQSWLWQRHGERPERRPRPPGPVAGGPRGFVALDGERLVESADGVAWRDLGRLPDEAPVVGFALESDATWVAQADALWKILDIAGPLAKGSSPEPAPSFGATLARAESVARIEREPPPARWAALLPRLDAGFLWSLADLDAPQSFRALARPGMGPEARNRGELVPFDGVILATWDLSRVIGSRDEVETSRREHIRARALAERVQRLYRQRERLRHQHPPVAGELGQRLYELHIQQLTDELDFLTDGLYSEENP